MVRYRRIVKRAKKANVKIGTNDEYQRPTLMGVLPSLALLMLRKHSSDATMVHPLRFSSLWYSLAQPIAFNL